jgi:heavy metal sensor kinase
VLLLGLTLILSSAYIYFQLSRSLQAQVDTSLQAAATQILPVVEPDQNRLTFQHTANAQEIIRELTQEGFIIRLMSPTGVIWDGIGNYQGLPHAVPTAVGATSPVYEPALRLYSRRIDTPTGTPIGWLQVAHSLGPLQEVMEDLFAQMLLALPLVVLLAALGGLFLTNRALRPIDRMTQTAQAVSVSDLTRRIGYAGPADELGRLATTLDQMLDRLQAAFEQEQRFIADASHELRTPLTAIKGRLEVTLSRPRTSHEYAATLADLVQEVDRLIRLSTDLLFLARLDQERLRWQPRPVDLSDLLETIVEHLQPLAETQHLTLVASVPAELTVNGDLDHLTRLLLNLLDNALKYTPAGGIVNLRAGQEGTAVCVAVSNTGPGIPPAELTHLFERFYRVGADRSRATGGAGLGLAIAAEIVRLHGGELHAASQPGETTTFTVRLPTRLLADPMSGRGAAVS